MTGLELKLERTRLGLRQYRLAQRLGLPPTTIWLIESGRRPVGPEDARRILAAMRELARQEGKGAADGQPG